MPTSKPFLILQLRPEDDTSDAEFAAILRHGALRAEDARRIRLERAPMPALDLNDFAAIIVGGSPFDVSTPEAEKSPTQRRIEAEFEDLLAEVIGRDVPFLGCCSGCSLLGKVLETPISTRYSEPVGCATVQLTPTGREDPLLRGFPERMAVLCGHKEACDEVPAGAALLLTSEACPVQMFRVGTNVYATQFHPEGDAEGFTVRIHAYRHHGYFRPEEADELIAAVHRAETPQARELLRRFVARYA